MWAPALRSAPGRHTLPRSRKGVPRENRLNATSFSSDRPLGTTSVASYQDTMSEGVRSSETPVPQLARAGWFAPSVAAGMSILDHEAMSVAAGAMLH